MFQTELTLPHISNPAAQAPDLLPCGSNNIVETNPHIHNPAAQAPDLFPCGFENHDDNRSERVRNSLLKVAEAGVKIDPEFDPRTEQGEKNLVEHLRAFAKREQEAVVKREGSAPGISAKRKRGASVRHQDRDPADSKCSAAFKAHCKETAHQLPYIMVGLDNGGDEIHQVIPGFSTHSGKQIRVRMKIASFLTFGWYLEGMVLNWERPHLVIMNGESKSAPLNADDIHAFREFLDGYPGGADYLIRLSNQWRNGATKITFARDSKDSLKASNQLTGDAAMAFMQAAQVLAIWPYLEGEKLRVIGHGGTISRTAALYRKEEPELTKILDRFCTDPNAFNDKLLDLFLDKEFHGAATIYMNRLLQETIKDASREEVEKILNEIQRYEWTEEKEVGLSVRMTPLAAALRYEGEELKVRVDNLQQLKVLVGFCEKAFKRGRGPSNVNHQLLQKNLIPNMVLENYSQEIGEQKLLDDGSPDPDSKASKNRKRIIKDKTSQCHVDVARVRQNTKRAMVVIALGYINAAAELYEVDIPAHFQIDNYILQWTKSNRGRQAG